jgi:hypothetical protein
MATNSAANALKTYDTAPEQVKSQYEDPRPKMAKGEEFIEKTIEVIDDYFTASFR